MPVASSSVAAPLRLRLLGAGSVWLEDRNLTFATRKMSAVLVYLALEGSVTRSKLAGLLWSDNAEDEARRNLRRELHRLRNAGLRAHFDGQGDVLHLRGFTCDALELDAALREGDSARASKLCQGELLEDVQLENADGFLSWLEDQRGRYRQMTVRALTLESERLETRGDWRGALGLQERLLHSNALQERTYRDLMRLHAQLGERERSLEVYARLQRILRDELGLEPLPETVRLAQGIRGAPSALGSEEGFTPSPRQFVPFVGRETVSRQLEASSGVVLVTGEPGVGKTRLVLEMNPAAVTVRFTEIGARTPLYAIAEILRLSWSDSMQRERLQALEPAWKRDLARVLPEVDETAKLEAIPDAPGRARFLESLAVRYGRSGRSCSRTCTGRMR
jgi:DNA-binding SARP family transcriptional activator